MFERRRLYFPLILGAIFLMTVVLGCSQGTAAPTAAPAKATVPAASTAPATAAPAASTAPATAATAASPTAAPPPTISTTSTPGTGSVAAPSGLANSGDLTYGVAATFPPFEYQQNGQLMGFDIEMGQYLTTQMGLQVKTLNITFDGLIPALQGSRIDFINSAMYINPQRAQQVDFIPYMKIGNSIVVPKGNPKNIRSLDDLSGKTVAVTRGAIEQTYANQENDKLKSEGKTPINIVAYPTAQDSVLATQQGRADAFFTSSPGAAYLLAQEPNTFEIASTFATNTEIGMAVRKGDTAMKAALQAALNNFVKSGKYAETMKKYNLPTEGSLFQQP